jgi:hypothetical protein
MGFGDDDQAGRGAGKLLLENGNILSDRHCLSIDG